MQLLYNYLKKYRKLLVGTLVLATINQVFSLLDPQIFRLLVDNYGSKFSQFTPAAFVSGVLLLILASMGVNFISRVAKNFQDYYVNVITQRVGAQMYGASVAHSFQLPYAVFEDQRSGELLQNLSKARDDAKALIISFVSSIFLSIVGIVFVIAYAFTVHWSIGLTYFLMIPLLGATTFYIGRKIKDAQSTIVKQTAELAGSTTETIRNVELVKSLGLETQETTRLNDVNEKILTLELQKVKMIRKLSFIQGTLINALRSGILFLMLYLIFIQAITIGQLFTLFIYSFFIFSPLGELGNVSAQYQQTKASMEILQKVLNTPVEDKPVHPVKVGPLEKIEFQRLSFSYSSRLDTPAVDDVLLEVNSGEVVAFVGPSGSGKTTLVKLIVGLYKPQKGKLLINGIDSKEIDYEDFRKRIGYVSQDTQLFAGTIRENLIFVNPDATDDDCLEALRHASALSIIERGGKGLETKIGEGGIKISGGERQRLAIARALLRDPELIIFDEATSSLDSLTEKSITDTIRTIGESRPNLMMIMVAHRLSTIAHADRIYVLEKGRLAEEVDQKTLLQTGTLFAALWREQSAVAAV